MVRNNANNQREEEEEDEEVLAPRTISGSSQRVQVDGRSNDQKSNASRSKHSETEQRRRSKINERFQVLRDIIPQSDQKRDKASFLLEVIQYIQFLQEKTQMYEGSYQGWSHEPSKLIPWRTHSGPVESFIDQSQYVVRNGGSGQEDNVVTPPPAIFSNVHQDSMESDFCENAEYQETADHHQLQSMQQQQSNNLYDDIHIQETEKLAPSSSGFEFPQFTAFATDNYAANKLVESEESNLSKACSQRLLNMISQRLRSSGVELSPASMSVQLDLGNQSKTAKDHHENLSVGNQSRVITGMRSGCEDQGRKRLKSIIS
ncbi:transcription factor BIM2-like [Impatiens glandulifera]|uniref:transcription factor BIM2-like n=1 Tax=Impatiens glandulifera TaxID=253017 RepID=UPI001FB05878|nr:transcription factor BIM2-like [Impatiens glandulifera]